MAANFGITERNLAISYIVLQMNCLVFKRPIKYCLIFWEKYSKCIIQIAPLDHLRELKDKYRFLHVLQWELLSSTVEQTFCIAIALRHIKWKTLSLIKLNRFRQVLLLRQFAIELYLYALISFYSLKKETSLECVYACLLAHWRTLNKHEQKRACPIRKGREVRCERNVKGRAGKYQTWMNHNECTRWIVNTRKSKEAQLQCETKFFWVLRTPNILMRILLFQRMLHFK